MNLVCQHCGAELTLDGALRTTVCAFCDSPSVVERPEAESGPRPMFTLGFVQPERDVRAHVAAWLKSRSIFCPGAIRHAQVEKLQGVYVPAWLYSGVARSDYAASIGERYTVVETYTTTDSKGNTVTRTRTRVETEWRSLAGHRAANVTDVLVTASRGLTNAELDGLEPYDWRALRRYSPAMVSGWLAENASLSLAEGLAAARRQAVEAVERALAAFMPGDTHRNLRHETVLEEEAADLVLVPVWVLNARYAADAPPIRIVVNGQTGAVHGRPPYSAIRIAIAVLAAAAMVAALYFGWGR